MSSIWFSKPRMQMVTPALQTGDIIPTTVELENLISNEKELTFVVFLRHSGCPFAERTVKILREELAQEEKLDIILITHGDRSLVVNWFSEIGGLGELGWHHDESRELYGMWGLGYSSLWHIIQPRIFWEAWQLKFQGIKNRDATGTRWQRSGAFAFGRDRTLKVADYSKTACYKPDIPAIRKLLRTVGPGQQRATA